MTSKIGFFLAVFIVTSVIGLYVGWNMIPEVGDVSPITGQSVDDPTNTIVFLAWILVSTGVLLVLIKVYKGLMLFRLLEVLMVFIGCQIVFSFVLFDLFNVLDLPATQLVYEMSVLVMAALMVVLRLAWRKRWILNATLAVTVGGVAGLLGSTLGFVPSVLFVVGLSVYDVIAVFGTKHMITLADEGRVRKLPVMFETSAKGVKTGPRKVEAAGKPVRKIREDILALGTGDVVIPVVLFVSILRDFEIFNMLGAYLGAMVGLAVTIYYVTRIKRIALPALPPIVGFSLLGFGLSLLL